MEGRRGGAVVRGEEMSVVSVRRCPCELPRTLVLKRSQVEAGPRRRFCTLVPCVDDCQKQRSYALSASMGSQHHQSCPSGIGQESPRWAAPAQATAQSAGTVPLSPGTPAG